MSTTEKPKRGRKKKSDLDKANITIEIKEPKYLKSADASQKVER